MLPQSLFEKLIFTTVRIETLLYNGSKSTGTGFIFSYVKDEKNYLFLVTNKHVIKDAKTGFLEFNNAKEDEVELGNKHTITIENFEYQWFDHPDKDIDIAILPFGPILHEFKKNGIDLFYRHIPSFLIPSKDDWQELDAIEDIIFVGYPNGLYDKKHLLPIVRKGVTATPASINFEGNPVFIIDASIFPGSSGSPVFICNIGSFVKKGTYRLSAGTRLMFLGLISSVFIRQDINSLEVISIPTKDIPVVKTSQMIDLGIVFKSTCLLEVVEKFLKDNNLI